MGNSIQTNLKLNQFFNFNYNWLYYNLLVKNISSFYSIKTIKAKFTTIKLNILKIKLNFISIFKNIFTTYLIFYKKIICHNLFFYNNYKFSNNLYFLKNSFYLLKKFLEKYKQIFKYSKFIKKNIFSKNNIFYNKLIYLIKLNKIFKIKYFKKNFLNILFDNQIFFKFKFTFLVESKLGLNFIFLYMIKLSRLISLSNFLVNFFCKKFTKNNKKFFNKISSTLFKFYNYIRYSKYFSFKNYNFLILNLLFKLNIDLKYHFYYIFYKYTYKDQKIFFDLYKYIYKIYNKNDILNQLKIFNLNIFKNLNKSWNYKSLILNKKYLKPIKYKSKTRFILNFKIKYLKRKQFFSNNTIKFSKNQLLLDYLKYINYLFYKLNYFSIYKINKAKKFRFQNLFKYNFLRKCKTLKPLGLLFNKNKLANLFLLNNKPNGFNVLHFRKKLYYIN